MPIFTNETEKRVADELDRYLMGELALAGISRKSADKVIKGYGGIEAVRAHYEGNPSELKLLVEDSIAWNITNLRAEGKFFGRYPDGMVRID